MCVWFPDWPVQHLCVVRPELQASATQSLWQLVDPIADRLALEQLAERCHRFSPHVAIAEPFSPGVTWSDSLLLDITGLGHLFGSERRLADQLQAFLANQGYQVQEAIAASLGAAWALARHGDFSRRRSGLAPPLVLPGDQTAAALGPLPIVALRLASRTIENLARLGIVTIGQLAALPRDSLRSRFGSETLTRLDQAMGTAPEPIGSGPSTPRHRAYWSSPHAVGSTETLEHLLAHICHEAAAQLAPLGHGALRLVCRMKDADGKRHALTVGLYEPTACAQRWHELIALQWQRVDLSPGIVEMELLITHTVLLAERQQRLFAEDVGEPVRGAAGREMVDDWATPRDWGSLLERLAGRLGHQAVVCPRLVADAQPEWTVRWETLLGTDRSARTSVQRGRGRRSACTSPGRERGQRPLLMYRVPLLLKAAGLSNAGFPLRLDWRCQWHDVAWAEGPERIETGWWRHGGVRRDYWRVALDDGRRWWIFCDLSTRRWLLHGEFG